MPESDARQGADNGADMNIVLTDTQQRDIKRILKCGIYKELHKRGILSDAQLNDLNKRGDNDK